MKTLLWFNIVIGSLMVLIGIIILVKEFYRWFNDKIGCRCSLCQWEKKKSSLVEENEYTKSEVQNAD